MELCKTREIEKKMFCSFLRKLPLPNPNLLAATQNFQLKPNYFYFPKKKEEVAVIQPFMQSYNNNNNNNNNNPGPFFIIFAITTSIYFIFSQKYNLIKA